MKKHRLLFWEDNKGVAAIQMAIILPFLLVIIMSALEFGLYFLKEQSASRAVATASIALKQDPSSTDIKTNMESSGLGIMNLASLPNFVCAKSYADYASANTGSCNAGWNTSHPHGVAATTPYYIAVRAYAAHTAITPIRNLSGSFPPDINKKNIVKVVPVSATSTITEWVQVPAGSQISSGGQFSGDTFVPNNNMSPGDYCASKGFSTATGACRGVKPSSGRFYGSLVSDNSQAGSNRWSWSCIIGGGNAYWMESNSEILCIK